MSFIKHFSVLAILAVCCATAHADDLGTFGGTNTASTSPANPAATLESVYTALTSRIDNVVSQNSTLNDNYAKLLACSKLKMFYAPETSGADAQGCVAGTGTSAVAGGGGKWGKIGCPGQNSSAGNVRDLPDCPSDNMQGQACADVGQRCKIASSPVMNCHYDIHVNGQGINGFVCR